MDIADSFLPQFAAIWRFQRPLRLHLVDAAFPARTVQAASDYCCGIDLSMGSIYCCESPLTTAVRIDILNDAVYEYRSAPSTAGVYGQPRPTGWRYNILC